MAVETYSVTSQMVLAYLPVTNVTATSRPLSTGDIDAYIEDYASQMSGVLENAGLSPSSIASDVAQDDTLAQIQQAIIHGAVYACLQKIPGVSSERKDEARNNWLGLRDRYMNTPKALNTRRTRALSNVSTASNKTASQFEGIGYEF